jgi:hypothetical protein
MTYSGGLAVTRTFRSVVESLSFFTDPFSVLVDAASSPVTVSLSSSSCPPPPMNEGAFLSAPQHIVSLTGLLTFSDATCKTFAVDTRLAKAAVAVSVDGVVVASNIHSLPSTNVQMRPSVAARIEISIELTAGTFDYVNVTHTPCDGKSSLELLKPWEVFSVPSASSAVSLPVVVNSSAPPFCHF